MGGFFMEIIEKSRITEELSATYPDSRAGKEHNRRLNNGNDYSVFGVLDPVEISPEVYEQLNAQINAYLKICHKISSGFSNDPQIRKYVRAALLQFEEPLIRQLVESSPNSQLTGSMYASDIIKIAGEEGGFKSVEVNFGPVGGPPEAAFAQTVHPEASFPISSDLIISHILHSVNSFYTEACQNLNKVPKPFNERQVIYVENDGWYPGSIILVEQLKEFGMNIDIAPREAFQYDEVSKTLYLLRNGQQVSVDQLVLDFHLQQDLKPQDEGPKTSGEILKALLDNSVVAETSSFAQIVLGSKATMAMIIDMVDNPQSILANRLDINPEDLAKLEGMFPKTYQWRQKFFNHQTGQKVNGLLLSEFLIQANLVVKITSDGLYGGRGVYTTFDNDKDAKRLLKGVRAVTMDQILSASKPESANPHLKFLLSKDAEQAVAGFMYDRKHQAPGTKFEYKLSQLFSLMRDPENVQNLTDYGFNEDDIVRINDIHQETFANKLHAKEEVEELIKNLAYLLAKIGINSTSEGRVQELQHKLLDLIATQMILPIVFQEKLASSQRSEYRISGSVGNTDTTDHMSNLSSSEQASATTHFKVVYPVAIKTTERLYNRTTEDPINTLLEPEIAAPLSSTAKEFSLIPPEQRFGRVLVLMSGEGRHVRFISKQADEVTGIDLSPECIEKAQRSSQNPGKENYLTANVCEIFNDESSGVYDLVTLSGNSIIYLAPDKQEYLIARIRASLKEGGIANFDFTDVQRYSDLLKKTGPVTTSVVTNREQAHQRVIIRMLSDLESYQRICERAIYVHNNQKETTHELAEYYIPRLDGFLKNLQKAGYSDIVRMDVTDDYYSGMMRYRHLVRAIRL